MNAPLNSTPWVRPSKSGRQTRLRLFCFPYAGGGCASFHALPDKLPEEVEICRVQLPGREDRIKEPPFVQLAPLIQTLVRELAPYLTMPFAFFGYSMGALICFELAHQLQKQLGLTPRHLFAAASRAPQSRRDDQTLHALPEMDLVEVLRRMGATAPIILNNAELRQLFLPTIRADFAVCERYVYQERPPLQCPIIAYGGRQDSDINLADLQSWSAHTSSSFALRMLDGGHFFLHEARPSFLQMLSHDLSQLLLQLDGN